jgi:hypothetical protein
MPTIYAATSTIGQDRDAFIETSVSMPISNKHQDSHMKTSTDVYFSADVETDGSIPGPFSMLSFALVFAGTFDGKRFVRPEKYDSVFYKELRPISDDYEEEALRVNGLDRNFLRKNGEDPHNAMDSAYSWIQNLAGPNHPVLVAYPLSFDWAWLYWYFIKFSKNGSPFSYSRCFDIKTALAVKARLPISIAGRSRLPSALAPAGNHTHHAREDAIEQAMIFANVFEWGGV